MSRSFPELPDRVDLDQLRRQAKELRDAARGGDHEDAKQRMVQAGANGINWIGLVTEWTPDYTTAERDAVYPGILAHDGAVALSVEYLRANIQVPASRG